MAHLPKELVLYSGSAWPKCTDETDPNVVRKMAANILRHRRRNNFVVRVIEPGQAWQISTKAETPWEPSHQMGIVGRLEMR